MEVNFDDLPDDILLHLFQYLGEKNCMAFSLSGVSKRFSLLHGERRTMLVHQCYFVTGELFHSYISNWVCPEVVTVLDVSHCYWLPRDLLLDVVLLMKHLNSLYIQDTKLDLSNLSTVFESCNQISKIGISLTENDYGFQLTERCGTLSAARQSLSKGFARIVDIKILAFNSAYYIDSWCLVLRLLSYCKICVDLHMEMVYSEEFFRYGPFGRFDYDEEFVNRVLAEFFPHLGWMASLKKLVILKRGCVGSYEDKCVKELINWIFSHYNMNSIERVWIKEEVRILSDAIDSIDRPKSILCGSHLPNFDWNNQRIIHLEHIGEIELGHRMAHSNSSNLRYVHGYCINTKLVDELCRNHPKLEYLLLDDADEKSPFHIKDDWKLLRLKTLVYRCFELDTEILERFVNATPNLEALHIGFSNLSALDPWPVCHEYYDMVTDYLKVICCARLITLSLNALHLFDGEFFETVFKGCPQLRNLHICGGLSRVKCFENLRRFMPVAGRLRDLRLQYVREDREDEEDMDDQSLPMLNALIESSRLERVVLYEEVGPNSPWDAELLQNALFNFVKRMQHLVAFCFITASDIQPKTVNELKQKFDEHILPTRPAFWYHVGQELPRATDPTVPRIHYDQIVRPIRPIDISPDFS